MLTALDAPVVVGLRALLIMAVRRPGASAGVLALEPRGHLTMQVWVVGLEAEHVVRFAVHNRLGNGLLAPHGINRHDAALDAQQLEEFGDGGDFIGLLVRLHLPEQHAGFTRPGAHEVQRRLPVVARAAQCFAINGHHALHLSGDALQPADAHLLQRPGVDQLKHPPERVVRGNPVGQLQKRGKPVLFCLAKLHHIHPVIGSADDRAQRDHQQIHQLVAPRALDARIGHLSQIRHQAAAGTFDHRQFRLQNHSTVASFILSCRLGCLLSI